MTESPRVCDELANVPLDPMPEGGCIECLAIGDTWVHLRFCVACGGTRCCESSKNQHSLKHWQSVGHGVIRSKEPGDNWAYCYKHDSAVSTPATA